jgi:hypothetical protein
MATTQRKFEIIYYNSFGFFIQKKFAKSIDTLILSKKVKEGVTQIYEYIFCPIEQKYIITEEYDLDTIESKPNLSI